MKQVSQVGRDQIMSVVTASLSEVLARKDNPSIGGVGQTTSLIGRGSVLDSLDLVTLVIDVEQRLEQDYHLSFALADDRAMSQRNSPFRTVESLTDYIMKLIDEERQSGGA